MKVDKDILIKLGGIALVGVGTLLKTVYDKKDQEKILEKLVEEKLKER